LPSRSWAEFHSSLTRIHKGLIGQDYAIWGFFANFNLGPAKIPSRVPGLTSKNLLSISPLTLGPFVPARFRSRLSRPGKAPVTEWQNQEGPHPAVL